MRIGELGHEVELEGIIPLDVLVSNLHGERVALPDQVLLQHGVDDWVDVFVDVLKEEREAEVDADLEVLEEVGVVERAHLERRLGLLLLDPRDGLLLRVDAERVARRARGEDAVLDRELVLWQALARPLGRLHLRRQQLLELEGRRQRNLLLAHVRLPGVDEHASAELEVEGARVREEAGGQQAVAHEELTRQVERLHVRRPARALASQPRDQLGRRLEPLLHGGGLLRELLLLGAAGLELGVELEQQRRELLHFGLHLDQLLARRAQHLLTLRHRRALWVDGLGDTVVIYDGIDPFQQACAGGRDRAERRGRELVLEVALDRLDLLVGKAVLLELDQRAQEAAVGHHRLGHVPRGRLAALKVLEDDHASAHVLHERVRLRKRLELGDVVLLQIVERLCGLLERRQRLLERRLRLSLLLADADRIDLDLRLLLLRDLGRGLGFGCAHGNLLEHNLHLGTLLVDLDLRRLQLDAHRVDLGGRLHELQVTDTHQGRGQGSNHSETPTRAGTGTGNR